jgi:hypothetical protein
MSGYESWNPELISAGKFAQAVTLLAWLREAPGLNLDQDTDYLEVQYNVQ